MISLLEKHPNKITPHIPIEKPKKQLPQRFPVPVCKIKLEI